MNRCTFSLLLAVLCAILLPQASAAAQSKEKCSDTPPGDFPCPMEKNWGKCEESWMLTGKFCQLSCGRCVEEEEEAEIDSVTSIVADPADDDVEIEKPVEKEAPLPTTDGDIIKVGDSNFEIEAPKTIEVSGTESFKGFETDCETVLGTLKNVPGASIAYRLLDGLKEIDEDLHDELDDNDTQYTVFVPLDSAFEEYLEDEDIMDDPELQRKVMLEHITPIIYHTGMMEEGQDYDTLGKDPITVETLAPSEVTVTKGSAAAEVVLANIWACKSMIHLVDSVLAT